MSNLPPGFVLDSAPAQGPVYGPPPKAPAPPSPFQVEDQQMQRERAERDRLAWEATHLPDGTPKAKAEDGVGKAMTANKRSEMLDSLTSLEQFESDLTLLEKRFRESFENQGLATPREYLPDAISGTNEAYNAASMRLLPLVAKALGFTAKQMDTPAELARLEKYVPKNTDKDITAREKLQALRGMLERQRGNLGSQLGETQEEPVAAAANPPAPPGGSPPSPPPLSEGDPAYQAATGGSRSVPDPETASQVNAMLRAGAPYSEVNAYAQSKGMAPVSPREYAEARAFLRKNPNYDGNLVNATKNEPLDDYDQFITGVVGNDPSGIAGYAIGAGNFLTGNSLDSLSSDPERARQAMDVVSAESPNATAVGEVSGGILSSLLAEAGLARLGMGSGVARGLVADTTMGAANGAGMADAGDRGAGAVQGGLSALVGSAAGSGAMRVAGRAVSPSGGSLADLYEQGVRPTPGQRFADAGGGRGLAGMAGKALNATEEALQSVPVVGSAIRGARQEARDQFQVGAFNQALSEIGETLPRGMGPGTDPHKFAQEAFGRVYDKARAGMRMVADEELANDLSQFAPDIQTLGPQAQNKLKAILTNSVNSKISGGELSGEAYKGAVSDLGKHIARLRKGMTADDQTAADILEGVRGSLDSAARRHSDPAAVELLDAADAGYAKLVRIEGAAARRGGDAGTFSPAGFDSEVQKASGGIRSKAYLRGDAQMQDYAKAGRSLEDRMPNSGTPERMAFGATAAGGAAYLEPSTLGILGAIATAYAPGVRNVTKGALAPGGPRSKAIAAQLKKRARLAGAVGAATSVAALPETVASQ